MSSASFQYQNLFFRLWNATELHKQNHWSFTTLLQCRLSFRTTVSTQASQRHSNELLIFSSSKLQTIISHPQIPASPSHTYQCVNGHIVCEKCRPKTLRCPMCRVQMGRGRCLVADKILSYLQNNSAIKIGLICDSEKTSSEIDERKGQRAKTQIAAESGKATSEVAQAKRSTFLPFKIKLKTITFWKDDWIKHYLWHNLNIDFDFSSRPLRFKRVNRLKRLLHNAVLDYSTRTRKCKEKCWIAHECSSVANTAWISPLVCVRYRVKYTHDVKITKYYLSKNSLIGLHRE